MSVSRAGGENDRPRHPRRTFPPLERHRDDPAYAAIQTTEDRDDFFEKVLCCLEKMILVFDRADLRNVVRQNPKTGLRNDHADEMSRVCLEATGLLKAIGRIKEQEFALDPTYFDDFQSAGAEDAAIVVPLRGKRGGFTYVSAEDAHLAARFGWSRSSANGKQAKHYAVACTQKEGHLSLHRLIMGFPKGLEVDHINGNPLDNRRSNLRICQRHENVRNSRKPRWIHGDIKYRGIGKKGDKFYAIIWYGWPDRKKKYLGQFDTQEGAARAYDRAAKEFHGAFAILNFPEAA